nr:EamA family transporter [Chloroflexota bacterium]
MDKSHTFGFMDIALLAMVVIWGANFTVVKSALMEMTPMAFNALRFAGASVLTLILAWLIERDLTIARRDLGLVLLLSFIGNFIYQVLFIHGLARSSASSTSLLLSTSPIFVALVSTLTKAEKLSGRNWTGIFLSFLGIFLLLTGANNRVAIDRRTVLGNLLVLCSTISWATYTVLLKRLVQRTSALKATAWIITATTPLLIIAALPDFWAQDWHAISYKSWLGLLYSSGIAIGIGYVIWNTGVQRVGSVRTAVYSYFTPVVSVLVAWAFLGESMQPLQALGAVGILLGVWLGRSKPEG